MKQFLTILLFVLVAASFQFASFPKDRKTWGNTYYIATTGDDGNDGSIGSPWKTVEHITGNVAAGDVVYIRGGTYRSTEAAGSFQRFQIYNLTGTADNYITIKNYPGESPVFNCDDVLGTNDPVIGLYVSNCDYIRIEGIRLTGLAQDPSPVNSVIGMQVDGCYGVQIFRCEVDNIGGYGVYNFNSDSTHWKNCDIHHCGDEYSGWGGANGFNCTGGDASTDVTVEGCRIWWCSDDGIDLFGVDGVFTFKNNWSFWNGYEPGTFTPAGDGVGFKLGPENADTQVSTVRRYLWGNLAAYNYFSGFDENSGDMLYELYNNTAYLNQSYGFNFYQNITTHNSKNNLAYLNGTDLFGDDAEGTYNSWSAGMTALTNSSFHSLDSTQLLRARKPNGDLPDITYLRPTNTSGMIDVGNATSIPSYLTAKYKGAAPDLGCFESPLMKPKTIRR